jgi:NADPH:quinone reductase-like Zn-dependent oxidoreductase
MMKAICLKRRGGPETLVSADVLRPVPGPGEVLVRVHATAITPTEFTWSVTWQTTDGANRPFPIILGHEFSGVIEAHGPGVVGDADPAEGAAVFGMNDWSWQGAEAEYCLTRPGQLAPKPHSLDFVHAAEVPISALTAWQALFDHARLAAGQRVLVHGATGGVGAFAVQLAHRAGAHVIATTSTHNLDFARELGADEALDYTTTRFEVVVRDVDVVLDTVGGETQVRSWGVLKPGGILVSVVAAPSHEQAAAHGVRGAFFLVEPDRGQLVELGRLIDTEQLRPVVEAVYPLEQVRAAYARAQGGLMRGKIVLQVGG